MSDSKNALAILLLSEMLAADQIVRNRLGKVLPKGMEISHFSVLNHLSWHEGERTPAQLAEIFNVTRGAMTNTLNKLEWAGHIHVRPDWEDARRKMVAISPAGNKAREQAISAIAPMIGQIVDSLGEERVREVVPLLREMRHYLVQKD
ncbi:MAG: MarR family transcriptional regulator [Pseudomonadota bacterium]